MNVQEIQDRATWDTFILKENPNTFLHSWNWKVCNERLGEKTVSLGAYENKTLLGVALGITVTAKRGSFLFCPHGPISQNLEAHAALLKALQGEAKRRNMRFLRVSPLLFDTEENRKQFSSHGFHPAPIHMHSETAWVLDIHPSEERIFSDMRKTTRNLIRRAEKERVSIRFSTNASDLELFQSVYSETADRERFVPFSNQFLEQEFRAFAEDSKMLLAFAEHEGDILASAMVPLFGTTGFYHQGASTRQKPKIPAAYLLHWEIIRELKRRGYERYNFWGIAPHEHHPWKGLTLFKKGFGGERIDYVHAQDFSLSSAYWITYGVERIRKWKRGY